MLNTNDETDPLDADSDDDGLSDGLELGVTAATAPTGGTSGPATFAGTDQTSASFVEDSDPASTTNPTDADTDNDGLSDGLEDANGDGATVNTIGNTGSSGSGETDPNNLDTCLLYTSPSPRDGLLSRMPSSA